MSSTRRVSSGSPYEAPTGFCRALKVGSRILVAGTAPIADDGSPFAPGDAHAQARRCFDIAGRAAEELGGSLRQAVRTRMFLVRAEDWKDIARAHGEVFGQVRPVATAVVVAGLLDPEWRVEVEVEIDLESTPADG